MNASVSGHRMLVGKVAQATAIGNAEPDTNASYVGLIARTADTNWTFSARRAGPAQYVNCGANFPKTLINTPIELWISIAPNSGVYELEIRRLDTLATNSTTFAGNDTPGVNSFMAAHVWTNTSASTTIGSIELAAYDCFTY